MDRFVCILFTVLIAQTTFSPVVFAEDDIEIDRNLTLLSGVPPQQIEVVDTINDGRSELLLFDAKQQLLMRGRYNGAEAFVIEEWGRLPELIGDSVEFLVADVNGDKKQDIVVWSKAGSQIMVGISTPDKGIAIKNWGKPPEDGLQSPLIADVNGDGNDDLVLYNPLSEEVWIGLSDQGRRYNWSAAGKLPGKPIMPLKRGDFNGDGFDDLIAPIGDPEYWWRAYSNGKGMLSSNVLENLPESTFRRWEEFHILDLNADKLSDILIKNSATGSWWAAISNTGGSIRHELWSTTPAYGQWQKASLGDFDGNAQQDLLFRANNGRYWWIVFSLSGRGSKRLVSQGDLTGRISKEHWVGDFDGDNQSDVLFATTNPKQWWLLRFDSQLKKRLQSEIGQDKPVGALQKDGPQVCLGFPLNSAGIVIREGQTCPNGSAFYSIDDVGGSHSSGETVPASGTCCPLPYQDILIDEHLYVSDVCPANHIVTGSRAEREGCSNCKQFIRCTQINTAKYQLGPNQPGLYWGYGYSLWRYSKRVNKDSIPVGIRYGVGRRMLKSWDSDGCVGYPWGSLLTGKKSKYCNGFEFRQLQYRETSDLSDGGRQKGGSAVKMFPDCRAISDVYRADGQCIP